MTESEIRDRVAQLDSTIAAAETERTRLRSELASILSKFTIGDRISWKNKTGVVIACFLRWGDAPNWKVQPILKNGSLGKIVAVCDYDNPKLVKEGITP